MVKHAKEEREDGCSKIQIRATDLVLGTPF